MAKEIRLPDIGDFKDVPVIEIQIAPGKSVRKEETILTLESDKATMDVPAPEDGVIGEVRVKVGDKVSQGALLATYAGGARQRCGRAARPPPAQGGGVEIQEPRPKAAARRAAAEACGRSRAGRRISRPTFSCSAPAPAATPPPSAPPISGRRSCWSMRGTTLGGVCLNVGCIPSKALLHVAKIIDDAAAMGAHGVELRRADASTPQPIRGWKDGVVKRLTTGLTGLAKQRKVRVVTGEGQFTSPNTLRVETAEGARVVRFNKAIIAAGSEPAAPGFIPADPRIWDSTGALEISFIPKRMLVLGGGHHRPRNGDGLSFARRGHHRDRDDGPADAGGRPRHRRPARQAHRQALREDPAQDEGDRRSRRSRDGLNVATRVRTARRPRRSTRCWSRSGGGRTARASAPTAAGVAVDERGFIAVDRQMRTNVPHIFAIGDIVGQPMLAHKATHEGKVAAEVASGHKSSFDAKAIPSVAYTDPEVAWAGLTETEAKAKGIKYGKAVFPWAASGRSLSLGRDEGVTKTLWDEETQRLIGCGIVGPNAGDLISEAALAIEMGAEAEDIGLTIHPHPTLSETFAMSAEAFAGTLTDLYMPKKK